MLKRLLNDYLLATPAFQPTQGGVDLAILFFMVILRQTNSGASKMTLSLPGLTSTGVITVCE